MRNFRDVEEVIKSVGRTVITTDGKREKIDHVELRSNGDIDVYIYERFGSINVKDFMVSYKILERGDFHKYTIKISDFDVFLQVYLTGKIAQGMNVYVPDEKKWGKLRTCTIEDNKVYVRVLLEEGDNEVYKTLNFNNDIFYLSIIPE